MTKALEMKKAPLTDVLLSLVRSLEDSNVGRKPKGLRKIARDHTKVFFGIQANRDQTATRNTMVFLVR